MKEDNDMCSCFKKQKIIKVGPIRYYQDPIFACDCWNDVCPEVFHSLYTSNVNTLGNSTRNAKDFVIGHRSSTRYDFTIRYLGPNVWNSLPPSIRAVEHQQLFKIKIKR